MIYVYKKNDLERKNPLPYAEGVKFKSLLNKAIKIETELREYFLNNNLMFDYEDEETKRHLYKAIDELRSFKDNLKLKKNYKE